MENLLCEELRRRTGESLQRMWERIPAEELTPENEDEIAEAVRPSASRFSKRMPLHWWRNMLH
jgi:hypothetical protein